MKMPTRFAYRHRSLVAGIALLQIVALSGVAGCGGGGGGSTPDPSPTPTPTPTASPIAVPTVSLNADQADLLRGQSAMLQWNAANATTVVESNFGAGGVTGSVAVTPTQTTTYSLRVRNDSGQTADGSVTVRVAEVAVAVSPGTATVDISRQVAFVPQVGGAADTSVTWSVQEDTGGTITAEGLYTAPSISGTYHIRATSNSDTSKVVVVEVRVRAATGTVTVN